MREKQKSLHWARGRDLRRKAASQGSWLEDDPQKMNRGGNREGSGGQESLMVEGVYKPTVINISWGDRLSREFMCFHNCPAEGSTYLTRGICQLPRILLTSSNPLSHLHPILCATLDSVLWPLAFPFSLTLRELKNRKVSRTFSRLKELTKGREGSLLLFSMRETQSPSLLSRLQEKEGLVFSPLSV